MASGAEEYRQVGTDRSPGTMVFTVVGDVAQPGVFELPLGTSLRVLLSDIAGARDIKAVFSGVSNPILTPAMLDTPMDYESMAQVGSGLGSGGFIVYDSDHCIVRVVTALSRFLAVESCGQCTACKMGTGAINKILLRIDAGDGQAVDLQGLPVGAQVMVASLLTDFEDELVAHIGQRCWSGRTEIIPKIDDLDLDTGRFTYDSGYHRKQLDWTFDD